MEERFQADKTKGNKTLDFIQTGLDIVGLIPVVGGVRVVLIQKGS